MVFGIALATAAGLAGAIFYVAHHITIQTTLFLVAGLIERQGGSTSVDRLGGLAAALAAARGAVLRPGDEPRRHPAVLRLPRQARPAPGRASPTAARWRSPLVAGGVRHQPAHPVRHRPGLEPGVLAARRRRSRRPTPRRPRPATPGAEVREPVPVGAGRRRPSPDDAAQPSGRQAAWQRGLATARGRGHGGHARPADAAAASDGPLRPLPGVMVGATAAMVAVTVALTVIAGPLYGYTDRAAARPARPHAVHRRPSSTAPSRPRRASDRRTRRPRGCATSCRCSPGSCSSGSCCGAPGPGPTCSSGRGRGACWSSLLLPLPPVVGGTPACGRCPWCGSSGTSSSTSSSPARRWPGRRIAPGRRAAGRDRAGAAAHRLRPAADRRRRDPLPGARLAGLDLDRRGATLIAVHLLHVDDLADVERQKAASSPRRSASCARSGRPEDIAALAAPPARRGRRDRRRRARATPCSAAARCWRWSGWPAARRCWTGSSPPTPCW